MINDLSTRSLGGLQVAVEPAGLGPLQIYGRHLASVYLCPKWTEVHSEPVGPSAKDGEKERHRRGDRKEGKGMERVGDGVERGTEAEDRGEGEGEGGTGFVSDVLF